MKKEVRETIIEACSKFDIEFDITEQSDVSNFIEKLESFALRADENDLIESFSYELQIVSLMGQFRHLEPGRLTLLIRTNRQTLFQILLLDPEGLFILEKVIKRCKTKGFEQAEVLALILIGRVLSSKREWEKAITKYEHALKLSHERGIEKAEFPCYLYISNDMIQRNGYAKWEKYLLEIEREMKDSGKDAIRAEVLNILSDGFFKLGNVSQSKTYLLEAIQLVKDSLREADYHNSLGLKILNSGDILEAIKQFDLAYSIAERMSSLDEMADSENNKGIALETLGKFDEAIHLWNSALDKYEEIGNLKEIGTVNGNIGNLMLKKGEHKQAKPYFEKGVKSALATIDYDGLATTTLSLGVCELLENNFEKAMNHYRTVECLGIRRGIPEAICASRNNIGSALTGIGRYQEAKPVLEECLEDAKKFELVAQEIKTLGNLVILYVSTGEFQIAIEYSSNAMNRAEMLGDPDILVSQLNSHGRLLSLISSDDVREYFEKARKIAETHNLPLGLESSLFSLSLISNTPDEALDLLNKCLEMNDKIGHVYHRIAIHIQKANIYRELQKFENARNLAKEALQLAIRQNSEAQESDCLSCLADTELISGNFDKSLKYSEDALAIDQKIGDRRSSIIQLTRMGQIYHIRNIFDKAYNKLKEAIDLSENLLGHILPQQFRSSLRTKVIGCYSIMCRNILVWALNESGKRKIELLTDYVKYSELAKAREMRDQLENGRSKKKVLSTYPEYESLLKKEQELTEKELYLEMEKVSNPELENQIQRNRQELDKLRRELQQKYPEPGLIRSTSSFDPIPRIKESLLEGKNVVIWDFFYLPEMSYKKFYVLSIKEDVIELHVNENVEIEESIKTLVRLSDYISNKDYNLVESELMDLGNHLGKMLPDTLWSTLDNQDLLILIPHGPLHKFPWSIAKNPNVNNDEKSEGYLGLEIPILRSYSIGTAVYSVINQNSSSASALLVSNPNFNRLQPPQNLPGAEEEIKEIEVIFNSYGFKILDKLERSNASKEAFCTALLKQPSIIHFAGHAQFIFSDPWRSHLSFYSSSGYEKYSITDMYLNRLENSPLVFLSACNTAFAKMDASNEPIAMVQGLLLAGAGCVIASNWSLLDPFVKFFSPLYYAELLKEGVTTATALHKAKLKSHLENIDPIFLWASFDLYGNPFAHYHTKL